MTISRRTPPISECTRLLGAAIQRGRVLQIVLVAALLFGLSGAARAQRTVALLDDQWMFRRADVAQGADPALDDASWERVSLPHTWNATDGEHGGAYYRGAAWYRRVIQRPAVPAGRRKYIEFDGATMAADVWVNGRLAGRHEGGYARFRLDVTQWLRPGRNVLAVRVDNGALPQVAPLGGDFTVYGGLIRPVRLIETDSTHIELLDHGGPGVQVETPLVTPTAARLDVRVQLRNDGVLPAWRTLRMTLRDAAGRVVGRRSQSVRLEASRVPTLSIDRTVTVFP